jgi:AAA15 family ATPase/GTPase
MLINFNIQNFGSIKDKQTLSFEAGKSKHLEDYYVIEANGMRLLKLGLIYGANASGKTTILRALDFLRNMVLKSYSEKTETLKFEPFLFDVDTPNQNTIFSVEFIQNDIKYFYEIEFNHKSIIKEILYKCNPKKALVYKRTTNIKSQFSEITFGNKLKLDEIFVKTLTSHTLWNITVLGGFNVTNIEIDDLTEVRKWFENYLNPLIIESQEFGEKYSSEIRKLFSMPLLDKRPLQKQIVLDILKKADFNIYDIKLKKENKQLSKELIDFFINSKNTSDDFKVLATQDIDIQFGHKIHEQIYYLPQKFESQGTQQYYVLAGFLYSLITQSMMLSIDELESSLHPDLFQHFLLSFLVNSKKSQIIATTHNREILNNKDIFRNDAIWITDKDNENCATKLYSLADFDTSVIRDTSNIYNAYKIGKLGGTPNLGSYYINTNNEGE